MNQRNMAASVRARLLNRARDTQQDFNTHEGLLREALIYSPVCGLWVGAFEIMGVSTVFAGT